MTIKNDELLKLVTRTEKHMDLIANFCEQGIGSTYKTSNTFPDITLETLKKRAAEAKLIAKDVDICRKNPNVSNQEHLMLDTLDFILEYGNYPAFLPTTVEHYYLTFDITTHMFPLLFSWNLLDSFKYRTPEEAAKHMELMSDYPRFTAQLLDKLKEQAKMGLFLSAHAIDIAAGALRSYAVEPALHPGRMKLGVGAATKEQIEKEDVYFEEGKRNLLAAVDYLCSEEYRRNAPNEVGLCHFKGGKDLYRVLRKFSINYDIPAEELHKLGKTHLEEIDTKQAEIRGKLGFSGSHREFIENLRGNPRFYSPSGTQLVEFFNKLNHELTAGMKDAFHKLVKTPCRVVELTARNFGYYETPAGDNPMGTFYFNSNGVEDKCQISGPANIAHELIPGHHMQIASVLENQELHPLFKKFKSHCYNEGWAEYAATLAGEYGLYHDDYDIYGRLEADRSNSVRLVADTGLNEFGWSLDEAADYIVANTDRNKDFATFNAIRYATSIPGQGLTYKFGYIKMLELREKYKSAKGEKYDIRDFHSLVLETGTPPMDALERYLSRELKA